MDTTASCVAGVTVWYLFVNCKLDMHFVQGNLNAVTERDNTNNGINAL